jgi:hypothetical protein
MADESKPRDSGKSGTPLTSESVKRAESPPANGPDDAPERSAAMVEAQEAVRLPNAEELEEARKGKFKDGPGTVAVDADPDDPRAKERRVEFVFIDEDGKEAGRKAFKPK